MAQYTFDLSKKIKNKTITLKKNSADTIKFDNDAAGQVVMSESGDNILFTVYKTEKIGYTYSKVVEKYDNIGGGKYRVTSTKYVYAKNGNEWEWKQSGKQSTSTVSAEDKPSQITGEKKLLDSLYNERYRRFFYEKHKLFFSKRIDRKRCNISEYNKQIWNG